jgi:predicted transglutaminase-like cysteine proteinase
MRQATTVLAAGVMMAAVSSASVSSAAFLSTPPIFPDQPDRITFGNPVLAPMAGIQFCMEYRADCRTQKIDFRRRHILLTPQRWKELHQINDEVNQYIIPDPDLGPETEKWKIAPLSGNCHDYAVTKRHELLARGWPSRDLLLAEVVIPSGEHHLVLVVRTKDVDLVLDNLKTAILPVARTYGRYQWVRIQTPHNPYLWVKVRDNVGTAKASNLRAHGRRVPVWRLTQL